MVCDTADNTSPLPELRFSAVRPRESQPHRKGDRAKDHATHQCRTARNDSLLTTKAALGDQGSRATNHETIRPVACAHDDDLPVFLYEADNQVPDLIVRSVHLAHQ